MCDSRGWKRNVEIFIDSVLETEEEKGKRETERRSMAEKQGHRVSLLRTKTGKKTAGLARR